MPGLQDVDLETLEGQLEQETDAATRAPILAEIGRRYLRQGIHDQALRHLASARRLFEELDDVRSQAQVDVDVGTACTQKGEYDRALTHLERALDVAEGIGDDDLRARTLNQLGEQALRRGELDTAEELWTAARAHYEQYWDGRELARCNGGLAMIAAQRANIDRAGELARKAEEEAEASGDALWIGRAQLNRAVVLWYGDDLKRAKRYFRRAIMLFQKNRMRRELAEAYLRYGLFCGHLGDKLGDGAADPAAYWLAKSQDLFRELGGLADLERVREAFRRYGRRATDRVAELQVLQLLQELKQKRVDVQRAAQALSDQVLSRVPPDDPGGVELHAAEQQVSRGLDEMAMAEERFLSAVNAVIVERENIRTLLDLTRTLATSVDHEALPDRVAKLAGQLSAGDRAVVVLANARDERTVGQYGMSPGSEAEWGEAIERALGPDGRAMLLFREASPGDGGREGERAPDRGEREQTLRLGYAMMVPLRVGERVIGAVYVDKALTGGVFTERDLDLLAVFAGQAGAILDNSHIQEELRLAASTKAATLEAISDGIISIDATGHITAYNAIAARLLGIRATSHRRLNVSSHGEIDFLLGCLDRAEELDGRIVSLSAGEFLCNTRLIRADDHHQAVGLVATFTELKRATSLAHRIVGSTARYSFGDIVGQSPALKRQLMLAEAAARSDSNVLITGESGTGKEVLAQAIHNAGQRAGGPFVGVNCAAIPRDLLESELFGYESGAFTGARKGGRPGKFELAEGGTILLDEIGDMPLEMQAKLLRVLQERTAQRLGGSKEIPLNCRLIATTNRDLASDIARGMFRQDLFFRIRVIHIDLPPLRERPEDVARLTEHFLQVYSARMGKQLTKVAPGVMNVFMRYSWPGNIRELEHVLEGEVNLAPPDKDALDHVPLMLEDSMRRSVQAPPMPTPPQIMRPFEFPMQQFTPPHGIPAPPNHHLGHVSDDVKTMSENERELLEKALVACRGKIPQVARALGVSRGTVYNKMKKFNLDPADYRF
jgi:sigma-54 dependent transcriptional regulator, acetoin dehydrogenase operon transcriptional activator AcoR